MLVQIIKLIMVALLLTGCSATSNSPGLGHWLDTYPGDVSIWQCVEPFSPYKNREC